MSAARSAIRISSMTPFGQHHFGKFGGNSAAGEQLFDPFFFGSV